MLELSYPLLAALSAIVFSGVLTAASIAATIVMYVKLRQAKVNLQQAQTELTVWRENLLLGKQVIRNPSRESPIPTLPQSLLGLGNTLFFTTKEFPKKVYKLLRDTEFEVDPTHEAHNTEAGLVLIAAPPDKVKRGSYRFIVFRDSSITLEGFPGMRLSYIPVSVLREVYLNENLPEKLPEEAHKVIVSYLELLAGELVPN